VLNTCLFSDPTGAKDLYKEQLVWLEDRLSYAASKEATLIFVFGHHPWFLYDEKETKEEMKGEIPVPIEWGEGGTGFPDYYFPIPLQYRQGVLALFKQYRVSAAFSGHFHQNLTSKTSFGMPMIITGPLSLIFKSSGVPADYDEPNTRGIRIVRVSPGPPGRPGEFDHHFVSL
jgi:3',5'-cyclic AMP phosphodiesterase CpdA